MPRRRLPDYGAVGFLKLRPLAEGLQEMMLAAQGLQIGYKSLIYLLLACILPVWRW